MINMLDTFTIHVIVEVIILLIFAYLTFSRLSSMSSLLDKQLDIITDLDSRVQQLQENQDTKIEGFKQEIHDKDNFQKELELKIQKSNEQKAESARLLHQKRNEERQGELHSRRHEELQARRHEELQARRHEELQARRHDELQKRKHEELQKRKHEELQKNRQESPKIEEINNEENLDLDKELEEELSNLN